MLVLSSLERVKEAYNKYAPTRVISLLSEDELMPVFEGLDPAHHLKLYVERDACAKTISKAARRRAECIITFGRAWDGQGNILVHCYHGVSRSTAAAYIIACLMQPSMEEAALAQQLRDAAPHADPCPLIVAYADEILHRNGRMLDAIEDISLPCSQVSAPVLALPLDTSSAATPS